MMLLTVDWEMRLRKLFEGRPKTWNGLGLESRIKEINKLIVSGQAMITETIGTDKVLLDAGLL